MEVDQDHVASAGSAASTRSAAWKGQSTGRMKTRPSRLNTATNAVAGGDDGPVAPGGLGGIVGRLDDVRFVSQHVENFAAAVDVIAQRDAIDAGGDQLVIDRRRDARAAGGVFGVGHDQVELLALDRAAGNRAANDLPPRLADDVADEAGVAWQVEVVEDRGTRVSNA